MMKVGDYVRFDYHRVSTPIQIAKITETHYDSEDDSICYSTDIGLVIDESNLVKEPSPNIIDLIEVGDYVNDNLVKHIAYFEGVEEPIKKLIFADEYHLIPTEVCEANEIKSIVTKEQFSSMEYKVGE